MAEMVVMSRWSLGLVGRTTPEEVRKADWEEVAQIAKKWKAAGVRLLAAFDFLGQGLDGLYSHVLFYAVPSMDVLLEMNQDLWTSKWAKHVENYSLVIGVNRPDTIENWNKL